MGGFGLWFKAGSNGLVMSMWSVPDRETKDLVLEC
jgi:hypothetical protein